MGIMEFQKIIWIEEHPAMADNGVSKNNLDRGTPTEGR
jgi:hypothetical protein